MSTVRVQFRVPVSLKQEIDAFADENGLASAQAVCQLVKRGLAVEAQGEPVGDPWLDRAILLEALRCLSITKPSGYQSLDRIIEGAVRKVARQ